MKKLSLILTFLFLSLLFVSCSGSSGSDGKDAPPQEEEDTGGTTGGTTTGGTSGGTSGGGGGSACLSTNQTQNF